MDDRRGKRASLEHALRHAIRTGRLRPGDRIPSTRALAAQIGVARGTVVEAVEQLAAEGYLRTSQGRPTVVAAVPAEPAPPDRARRPARWTHDLRPGTPEPGSFPVTEWIAALRRAAREAPDAAYMDLDPRGRLELRRAVAGYLGRARGVRADPDRIVIVSGVTHGLELLVRALATRGRPVVATEDPGHPFHRTVVTQAGATVQPIEVDAAGARSPRGPADAVLVTPAHQYPTGPTMSPERRRELLRWARSAGAWVIEDDYDGEFRFDRRPVGALQGLDPCRVVYAGSCSKSFAPGARIGWLVLPEELLEPVVELARYREHVPVLEQLGLCDLIGSGRFDAHVRKMRGRYRARFDAITDTVTPWTSIPGVSTSEVSGGLHLLLRLPAGAEEALIAAGRARSLAIYGLGGHWHDRRDGDGVVLGFARPPAHGFRAALTSLSAALADALGDP